MRLHIHFVLIMLGLIYIKWSASKTRSGQTPLSNWTALSVKIPTFVSELIKTERVVHVIKFDELHFVLFAYSFFTLSTI